MAIKNGPGTVSSNLVFAYDVADTRNSYIGEPTTNLTSFDIASVSTNTDTSAQITVTSNSSEATYRGRLSKKISILSGYFNAYFYGYNTGVSSTKFSVSYKAKVSDGSHPSAIIGGGYIYGSAGSFFPSPTFTYLEDGWYLVTMLYSGTSMTLNSLTGMSGGGPGVIYITDYQAEAKDHPTPFAGVAGTRSISQGLLDISGYNRTLNLDNISFDSNAQITFDGTNDYIYTSLFPSAPNNMSAEFVFYKTDGNNLNLSYQGFVPRFAIRSTGVNLYHSTGGQEGDVNFSSTIGINTYYHIVLTYDPTGKYQCYLNGVVLTRSYTGNAANGVPGFVETSIGLAAGSEGYFKGTIPVARYYNKALSSSEIQQNYLAYKKRFGI
jgi:hypothetical protein